MEKFSEKLKDFFYDAIDYILMGVIILAVVGIIGWRLDVLFEGSLKDAPVGKEIESSKDKKIASRNNTSGNKSTTEAKKDKNNADDAVKKDNKKENDKNDDKSKKEEIVKVSIPKGSVSENVAEILKKDGLIKDEAEFMAKVKEMNLETGLRYGEYEIAKPSTMEDIIKKLSK
ncbi:MAG: endolytic transglycosylase MltG [Clostridiaceae bacterium]|nr:endolytic transglycosylase MltG [Clostridiaceae bacterium]MBW4860730.1 endolytic transglycosylase MltG [Clostridiaceae bacterium]MBW4869016.1 endolytic transglycosylase MltG [Clostridiaceae bacterium]